MVAVVRDRVAEAHPVRLLAGALVILAGAALAALSPPLAVVGGLVVLVGALTILAPFFGLVLGLCSVAITPEYLDPLQHAESALARGHRLLLLGALLPILFFRGQRRVGVPLPLIAYGVMFALTFSVSNQQPGLNVSKAIFALLTLTLGWIASRVRLEDDEQLQVLVVIAVVPIMSILAGIVLQGAGWTTVFQTEYTGVTRLAGASIPAFLAMMGVAGAAAGVLLAELGKRMPGIVLAVVDLVIVALTGTRGALAVTLILVLPLLWRIMLPTGAPTAAVGLRVLAAGTVLLAAGAVYVPVIVARSTNKEADAGSLDTSGRAAAWSFYLEHSADSRSFGRGLGAAPLIGEQTVGVIRGDFRGVHNEYVRTLVEGGWAGVVLVIGSIILYLAGFVRGSPARLRPHLLALLIGFALYSIVDNSVSTFQFFAPFGIILGIYGSCHGLASRTQPAGFVRVA